MMKRRPPKMLAHGREAAARVGAAGDITPENVAGLVFYAALVVAIVAVGIVGSALIARWKGISV